MPWPANGDYYSFKEASIKAKAPPVSGVYGLYNIRQYVLIGESADICEALLRHEKETGFLFGLYRPIGFTFEVCSPELRTPRAKQLVAEYRPVLQTRDLLGLVRSLRDSNNHDAFNSSEGAVNNDTPNEAMPGFAVDHAKASGKKFYFSRDQIVVLAAAFTVTAVSIGFLGILTGKQIEATRIVRKENTQAKTSVDSSVDAPEAARGEQEGDRLSYFDGLAKGSDAQTVKKEPSKHEESPDSGRAAPITEGKTPANETVRTPGRRTAQRSSEEALSQETPISRPSKREEPVKTWTVQVKSSADKGSADDWVNRLKSKGYNAFVVAADIQGRTWYRVRVGPFDTRHDAETLRKVLHAKEGFSDAFLAD